MAKNKKKRGKSARHGNMPAPYTKYGKTPYPYPWRFSKPGARDQEKEKEQYRNDKAAQRKRRAA